MVFREGALVRTNTLSSSRRSSAGEEVGSRRLGSTGSRWEREKVSTVDEVLKVKMLDTGWLVRASKVLRGPGLHI